MVAVQVAKNKMHPVATVHQKCPAHHKRRRRKGMSAGSYTSRQPWCPSCSTGMRRCTWFHRACHCWGRLRGTVDAPAVRRTTVLGAKLCQQVWAGSRYGMQGAQQTPAHDSLHWPPSPEHGAAVGHCAPRAGLVLQHWLAAMHVDPHSRGSPSGQVVNVT